jgi:SAM-dependent methyltransferase
MHPSVFAWVWSKVDVLGLADRAVLEVGSYDVNGSVRPFFTGSYVGVDMRAGPQVDMVAYADALPFDDESFDVVVSTEMLEHDPRPWRSLDEMARVLRHGGVLLLTARGYDGRGCFPVHDYPDDIWRFSGRSLEILANDAGLVARVDADPTDPGWFLEGVKP